MELPAEEKKSVFFIKSLIGKLMLVSFDEEDGVPDLHLRVAKQVGVSADQFLFVFQSRTLKAAQKLVEVVAPLGVSFYMQGLVKEGMMGQGFHGRMGLPSVWGQKVSANQSSLL